METKSSNSTTYGGILPILKKIHEDGIPQAIRKILGSRVKQAVYGKEDVIIAWLMTNYAGGEHLDHITQMRKNLLILEKMNLKIPSHDTIGRLFKSLATPTITKGNKAKYKKASVGDYNYNKQLNELLVEITKRSGLIEEYLSYTLDMDATFIPSKCHEANRYSYHSETGFHPMVCCIGLLPVFASMRSANVSPQTESKECVEKSINLLRARKIKIGRVRTDSGSYSKAMFEYLDEQNIKFYVGGKSAQSIIDKLNKDTNWKKTYIKTSRETFDCEETSVLHKLKDDKKSYRLVALRRDKVKDKRASTKWIDGGDYEYKVIITNDYKSSSKEIIEFYNQRGTFEHDFHNLKEHHGWSCLPFSKLNENHVFLLISAIANNVYQGFLKNLSEKLPHLEKYLKNRLEKFIRTFISVRADYINGKFEFNDVDIAYEKLM